ncbi:hemin-degrading factor [Aliihoeflea sp. 40Bstr573]|uniref:hemin-degrading factor n=1 Tax=Aliihoeflea sp. 40Bstr573 TaxID=2696467 RepID=UPI00209449BE|nr:ChuX/HutX family heme-like substrate-binding protein [Aliihoeflea sp. 40Bstr573]MCO6385434.1 hemin-degrading factor [Aliihoeflea sp. 40Bstr573]
MTAVAKPSPREIRQARADNSKMRERDLAAQLSISEAELVAAHVGEGATAIGSRVNDLLAGLEAVGEVMALTRNESAVHEKIGVYDNVHPGPGAAMVLGGEIDLRIFPKAWAHGFAVEKRDGNEIRRSLQFFDKAGEAVHKIHLRPTSNLYAFHKLVAGLTLDEQSQELEIEPSAPVEFVPTSADGNAVRGRWAAMSDPHDFNGLLRSLKISRREAVGLVGDDFAWQLDASALHAMFNHAAEQAFPIMCFVGNRGCIQIHSGPIMNVKPMGPWINVMDPTFHLHLRADHVAELWGVRKPTRGGHVTSIEAYDARGELIIQFFGKRREGEDERADWRLIAENLPRIPRSSAT